jgi:hypothetical protein
MHEKHQVSSRRGRIDAHDPPRFAGGLPGRYGHRLLPICCPDTATQDLRDLNLIGLLAPSGWFSRRVNDLRTLPNLR